VAKDRFHQVVKTALTKDGWNVTHDPLKIKVGGVDMEIDLGAERLLAAERGNEKIAVEVKSFLAEVLNDRKRLLKFAQQCIIAEL
jgi:predicted RecB family endonuclease